MSVSDEAPKPILVTVPQACAAISIGRTRFYELVSERRIRLVKIGGPGSRAARVPYEDLEALKG
ncbi:MAG: hypothetical protein WA324_13690, partial [Bryobacteraceae bacterium]